MKKLKNFLFELWEIRRVNKAIKALKKMKFDKDITYVHQCISYLEEYKKII